MHGIELVDAVIARVKQDGASNAVHPRGKPRPLSPEVLATLTFPGGKPLSPALARWLAFDASWFEWFDDLGAPVFKPKALGDYARDEYGMDWGYGVLASRFPGECYGVHFGSDSRRFLYVGEVDSAGEYPVLLLDTDDMPYIGVQYPGIDVYLGIHSGVISHDAGTYGDLIKHKRYGARMKEHAKRYFDGEEGKEVFDFGLPPEAFQEVYAAQAEEAQPTKAPKKKAAAKKAAKKKVAEKKASAKTAAKRPAKTAARKPAKTAAKKPAKKPAKRR